MRKLISAVVLLTLLASCASPPAGSPYGSPDEQRQRAGEATQELDRNVGGYK